MAGAADYLAGLPELRVEKQKKERETHTTASTDPHRTVRIIDNAYMQCVLLMSYGMRAMRTMRVCGRLPSAELKLSQFIIIEELAATRALVIAVKYRRLEGVKFH
uniref:SFRICE_011423 n=1 Tax=Spodoptera frugiperda TaxID=7108 RepID=A0A2H1V9F2_SPOFR